MADPKPRKPINTDPQQTRYVYQLDGEEMKKQIVKGETPEGWYDLIRDAKLAAPGDGDEEGAASPLAKKNVKDAKAEIAKLTDPEVLQSIIDLDPRKGVTDAAAARLAALG